MNTKKPLVFFSLAILAIFMVAMVSAADFTINSIEVDGINVASSPAVIAGENVAVSVEFTANVTASDIKVRVTIEGDKVDSQVVSVPFDVEAGHTYKKSLKIGIPSELKKQISDDVSLTVKIWNGDYKLEVEETLRVQRPSYNPVIKSVTVSQSVSAGESFPVDIVIKNLGYNDLDDLYVTVAISELGVYKTAYFGDLINLKENCNSGSCCDNDCDDTVSGRLFLTVPYGVVAGTYTLEVVAENDDMALKATKQISVKNDFASNVIVVTSSKTVSVGETAEYTLLLVNPTNSLKVYKIVSESNSKLTSESESVVAVPAGSSVSVVVKAKASESGSHVFNVNVLSGNTLEGTVTLTLNAEEKSATNPVVVLTIILAIIFLVLLVVLIVLLGRKPEKTEEFGESYY